MILIFCFWMIKNNFDISKSIFAIKKLSKGYKESFCRLKITFDSLFLFPNFSLYLNAFILFLSQWH